MSQAERIAQLISANSPKHSAALALIDAPELATLATDTSRCVHAWCDDLSLDQLLPTELKFAEPALGTMLPEVDLVWMRLPKSLTGLDEYASLIASSAAANVKVVAFGRNRDLSRSMNNVLSSYFDEVQASLGVGKYRALLASRPKPEVTLSWPKLRQHQDFGITVYAHGSTFATNKIDAGTRLLIDHLNELPGGDVLDFGSGSGVIATLVGRREHPASRVQAIDISSWAVDSTRRTAGANGVSVAVRWAAGTNSLPPESLDAIVTNPPFHRGTAKESEATLKLFADAPRILRPGGELWVVFNSHLPWRKHLVKMVGSTDLIAQNPHYTLIRAMRR